MSKYLSRKLVFFILFASSIILFNFVFLFTTITYSFFHGNEEYYRTINISFLFSSLILFIISLIKVFFLNIKLYRKFGYVLLGLIFCSIGPIFLFSKPFSYLPDLLFFYTKHQQLTEFAELINNNQNITNLMIFGNGNIYVNNEFATYNENWAPLDPDKFAYPDSVYYKYVIDKLNIPEGLLAEYLDELDDLNIIAFRKESEFLEFELYYPEEFVRKAFIYMNKTYFPQSNILEIEKINDRWYWIVYLYD